MTKDERIAELETLLSTLTSEAEVREELLRQMTDDLERARSELQIANTAAASQSVVATARATAIEEALAAPDGAPTNAILEAALNAPAPELPQ